MSFLSIITKLFGGLAVLILASHLLLKTADDVIAKFRLSPIFIGMTVIAIGTSLPEICVSFSSAYVGQYDVCLSNILGSNLFNAGFILGSCLCIRSISLDKRTLWGQLGINVLVAFLLACFLWKNGQLMVVACLVLLVLFYIYLKIAYHKNPDVVIPVATREVSLVRIFFCFVACLPMFYFSSRWVTLGALDLASWLNVSNAFIGFTVIATGTSLPELVTGIMATFKRRNDFIIGNVFGSNICNVCMGLGLVGFVFPLKTQQLFYLRLQLFMHFIFALVVITFALKKVLSRFVGVLFVVTYMAIVWLLYYYNSV